MTMSAAAERAAAYVDVHGDELARLRAAALLGRVAATAVVANLEPSLENASSLRRAVGICDDLRALSGPRLEGWARALARGQAPDGGWWPERELDTRLFETGMIAGHLAKTRSVRPELLSRATHFLAGHWSPDRVRAGSWQAIAAYAHVFANVAHDDADAVLQWCGRELGRGFATRAFDAVRTARVLVYCDAHGLPGAGLRPQELLVALVTEQAPDGSFSAWEGEGSRDAVESTLDALVALRRFGA